MFLPKQGYVAIAEESQDYYRQFVRLTCIHQRFLLRIAVEARSDAARRTARALIRIARMHGRNTDLGTQLSIHLNQSDLASLVGVSRQYLNELLSHWNQEGILIWKGSAPPVLFLDRLRMLLTPLDDWMLESEGWA
ncbi:MAG TPA: helix-turn-helix domain-containing protein [Rhizomicrobium sp.]|nr:helix-turn-helix domain-containing protein [Rhizomicrobium sp.]